MSEFHLVTVLKSKLGIYSFQTGLASESAKVRQLATQVLTDLDATKAKLLQAEQAVKDMELARYLNDGLVGQMKTLSGMMSHVEKQPLARQKYWKISLRVVEPKISALCDYKTSKDYKKARQVRDPSKFFL
jgi:hypothetical protein